MRIALSSGPRYLGQLHDEVVCVGHLRRGDDLVVGRPGFAEANVLLDRAGEEDGLLTDDADVRAKPLQVQRTHIATVERHSALIRLVETLDQLDRRALPTTRRTAQGHRLARRNSHRQTVENLDESDGTVKHEGEQRE